MIKLDEKDTLVASQDKRPLGQWNGGAGVKQESLAVGVAVFAFSWKTGNSVVVVMRALGGNFGKQTLEIA